MSGPLVNSCSVGCGGVPSHSFGHKKSRIRTKIRTKIRTNNITLKKFKKTRTSKFSTRKKYNESLSSQVMYRPELSNLIVSYLPDFQPEVNMSDVLKTLNIYKNTMDINKYNEILKAIDPSLHRNNLEWIKSLEESLFPRDDDQRIIPNVELNLKLLKYIYNIFISFIINRPNDKITDELMNFRGFKRSVLIRYNDSKELGIQILPKHLEKIFIEWANS